jgi:hypothetical protein
MITILLLGAAMDDYVAALLPDWERVPYALDFLSYQVGGRHEFPRFLCYECHAFRPHSAWNPYQAACSQFRVVVSKDPYYDPTARYRGDRVVYVRPPPTLGPGFSIQARAGRVPKGPVTNVSPLRRPSSLAPTPTRPVLRPRAPDPPGPPPPGH